MSDCQILKNSAPRSLMRDWFQRTEEYYDVTFPPADHIFTVYFSEIQFR